MTSTLTQAARRLALAAAATGAAISLAACGAGQISQTADQVAAVDGASGDTADGVVAVRDITVIVDENQNAYLKFTAANTGSADETKALKSATVDGEPVEFASAITLNRGCSVVVDSTANLQHVGKAADACVGYVSSSLENKGFPPGGTADVTLSFSNGDVTVPATVTGNHHGAGADTSSGK